MIHLHLPHSHDPRLVVLSIIIAVLASYMALDLAGRVTAAQGRGRFWWLSGGALAMGTGIWSMHFTGMLAFSLPIPVIYDVPTTLISLLAAIIASGIALNLASGWGMGLFRLLAGGLAMGTAIAGMHYVGMAAMRLQATLQYDPLLFTLSILIAICASSAALWLAFQLRGENSGPRIWWRIGSAVIMAAAITGMHYTGMMAAIFTPSDTLTWDASRVVNITGLGTAAIAFGTFMILGLTLLLSLIDQRLAAQVAYLAETRQHHELVLQGLNTELEARLVALRQSEERFKLMAWATIDAIWDWDLQTNQIWWGEGLQKIFHYSSETTQTDPEWRLDHIHPEDRAKVNRVIEQALEGGMEFWSKEYRFQRKDETYADIMDRGYIIRDDMGKPYRMIGAMMDITERKYMETSLVQANEKMRQFLNELQQRNRETILLNEMSHLLQVCQTAEEAYVIIADLSNQLFPRTAGALYMVNTTRTLVSPVASWGELPSAERMFAPDDCWALRRGQTHLLREDQAEAQCLHLVEPLPAVSYCVPMQAQGETLGVLHVQSQHEENLDEAKRQLAYTVVEQAGMVLSNLKLREELREQSIRDSLTGLYNRRYMEEVLKQQLSRVTRQLHPLGIIMIDIDHFKSFNDTYGHATGDALLRELGRFLQSHIRGEDIACRYGGEEFILIMPDASLEAARRRAELLRQEAEQLQLQEAGRSHEGITLSMGVAIYPQHGRTIETVLRAADAALYRAKQEGRDRVVVAEGAP